MKQHAEKPICRHCKGDRLFVDACAVWCNASKGWTLSSTYDAAFCADCDGETKLEWVQE